MTTGFHGRLMYLSVFAELGNEIRIDLSLIGRAERAPNWAVQSRFRVIHTVQPACYVKKSPIFYLSLQVERK